MSRKNKSASTTTAKKLSPVPPTAAEAIKPVVATIPATAVTTEKTVAAKTAETKVAANAQTTPVVVAKTECCGATAVAAATSACSERSATVSATIEGLHSTDADIARDAASKLGTLGDRTAVEPLIQALNNTCGYFHSVVRAAAAESLGTLGDTRAIEPLLTALTDPIAEVSSESIRALATLGDAQAIDALSDVVRNRAGFFLPLARHAAILGLAKLGGDRAIETLRSVAADEFEDTTIRNAAEAGLTKEATASAK